MNTVRNIWENSNITGQNPDLAGIVRFDEPMSAHTTFRIGGPADCFAEPSSVSQLVALIEFFSSAGCPVSVVGGGSNLLVADRGIRGAVISTNALVGVSLDDSAEFGDSPGRAAVVVRAASGTPMDDLVSWCADRSLAGLERFSALPGSVGGAVFMNARCYERAVSDAFRGAECLVFGSRGCTLERHGMNPGEWDYKKSPFQGRTGPDPTVLSEGSSIVVSAFFSLSAGNRDELRREMERCAADREAKGHFRFPSAGSMFKNDRAFGKPSGKIIDEAGLRGFSVGKARVAPWHGNIVVNEGGATADDVRILVEEIRRRVLEATGFELESEVVFAGDWRA